MMHEDLVPIQRLWANIGATEQLEGERQALEQARVAADAELREAHAARDGTKADLDEFIASERAIMRKLETYQKRVGDTRRLIDEGKAHDFLLAQKQLDACTRIADELETSALEAMETRDATREHLEAAERRLADAEAAVDATSQARKLGLPRINDELATLAAERPELEGMVPVEHRSQVMALRKQRRSLTSFLRDGTCSACNFSAPPQTVLEIRRGSRVHTCRTCGRFLLPPD